MVRLAATAAVLLMFFVACSGSSKTNDVGVSPSAAASVPKHVISARSKVVTTSFCRTGSPLANVYHPDRLLVFARCLTATGTVRTIRAEDDGDIHFDLAVDVPFRRLLNNGNVARQHGWLVIEIVPADRPGCTRGLPPAKPHGSYDFGICTGSSVRTPAIGSRVSVTGPYVFDAMHGWMEIHPAWHITLLSGSFLLGR